MSRRSPSRRVLQIAARSWGALPGLGRPIRSSCEPGPRHLGFLQYHLLRMHQLGSTPLLLRCVSSLADGAGEYSWAPDSLHQRNTKPQQTAATSSTTHCLLHVARAKRDGTALSAVVAADGKICKINCNTNYIVFAYVLHSFKTCKNSANNLQFVFVVFCFPLVVCRSLVTLTF